jgi:hypothetical protein
MYRGALQSHNRQPLKFIIHWYHDENNLQNQEPPPVSAELVC